MMMVTDETQCILLPMSRRIDHCRVNLFVSSAARERTMHSSGTGTLKLASCSPDVFVRSFLSYVGLSDRARAHTHALFDEQQ